MSETKDKIENASASSSIMGQPQSSPVKPIAMQKRNKLSKSSTFELASKTEPSEESAKESDFPRPIKRSNSFSEF